MNLSSIAGLIRLRHQNERAKSQTQGLTLLVRYRSNVGRVINESDPLIVDLLLILLVPKLLSVLAMLYQKILIKLLYSSFNSH